jgi:hypothetical protein
MRAKIIERFLPIKITPNAKDIAQVAKCRPIWAYYASYKFSVTSCAKLSNYFEIYLFKIFYTYLRLFFNSICSQIFNFPLFNKMVKFS